MRRLELTGQRFGMLTVTTYADTRDGNSYWQCRCDCGNDTVVRGNHLRRNLIKSCGCEQTTAGNLALTTHGMADKHPLYATWLNIRRRCYNPNDPAYPRYGGVGIKLCERWQDFAVFAADLGERPEGKSLDRYPDPHGDYEPSNCRWATPVQQRHNRRPNHQGCPSSG